MSNLNGYRLLWVMVFFDLPTLEPEDRAAYTRFRNFLLDEGFEQAQYSVYVRHTSGKEAVTALIRRIEPEVPPAGKVDILQFTDRQYENIVSFRGRKNRSNPKNPDQYVLF